VAPRRKSHSSLPKVARFTAATASRNTALPAVKAAVAATVAVAVAAAAAAAVAATVAAAVVAPASEVT